MWNTLIVLIERWWREKPRIDIVRAAVGLRNSMVACQQIYLTRRESPCSENFDQQWIDAVNDLTRRLQKLDDVLAIFSPTTQMAIMKYRQLEGRQSADDTRLQLAANDLGQPLGIDVINLTLSINFED